jgi:serine/threonine-protein kinase RsbW
MKEQPLDLVNLVIPAKTDFVGIARLAVSGIANRMGFSYDDIEDLKLAVSEACTNAVVHNIQMEKVTSKYVAISFPIASR